MLHPGWLRSFNVKWSSVSDSEVKTCGDVLSSEIILNVSCSDIVRLASQVIIPRET